MIKIRKIKYFVIKYFKPRRIFFLGDTFHDMSAWKRMPDVNKSRLLNAVENLEAVWIEGNHDQGGVPDRFKSLEKIDGMFSFAIIDKKKN